MGTHEPVGPPTNLPRPAPPVAPSLFDTVGTANQVLPIVATPPPTIERAAAQASAVMTEAARNADPEWRTAVEQLIRSWAMDRADGFTTDDLWSDLEGRGYSTHEPRALGPIIAAAARNGLITHAGRTVPSARRHSAPIPVWIGTGFQPRDPGDKGDVLAVVYRFVSDSRHSRQEILDEIIRLQTL